MKKILNILLIFFVVVWGSSVLADPPHRTLDPENIAITGGTIDGTVIGGTTPAAGSFTDVDASGDVTGATYGTDLTNAELQTLDDCETTELFVGGGAGSAPVCTTATGSDAPVRATSPTLSTPTITGDITGDGSYFTGLQNIQDLSGPSYHLTGDAQYIEIADSSVYETTTNDFSISLHIKPNNVTDTGKRLVSKTDGTTGFEIVINEDDLQVALLDNANNVTLTNLATAIFTANTWIKLDITFDRDGNIQAYSGGKAIGTPISATATATIANASVMRLGTETGGTTNEFSGEIGQFRYHNRLLSATDSMKRSNPLFAEEFKYVGASQTAEVTGDDNDFDTVGNWTNDASGATLTGGYNSGDGGHDKTLRIEAGDATFDRATLGGGNFTSGGATANKAYRVTFDYKWINAPSVLLGSVRVGNSANEFAEIDVNASGWTAYSSETVISAAGDLDIYVNTTAGGHADNELLIDNVTLTQIGAVLNLNNTGITSDTWFDRSGNDLDGTVSGAISLGADVAFNNVDIYGNANIVLGAAEQVLIDGRTNNRTSSLGAMRWNITPAAGDIGEKAIHFDIDMNNVNDTMGLAIDYLATSLSAGEIGAGIEFNAELPASATGGVLVALLVDKSGVGTGEVQAVHAGVGVVVIHQESGSFGAIAEGRTQVGEAGAFTDTTTNFNTTATDSLIFGANTDWVYVGMAAAFDEISVAMDTVASGAGVKPVFYFSIAGPGWTAFTPNDSTNGFRNTSGIISWEVADLTNWVATTIDGDTEFWIRIQRTQSGGGVGAPKEDQIQVAASTAYGWDENAVITASQVNITPGSAITGLVIDTAANDVSSVTINSESTNFNALNITGKRGLNIQQDVSGGRGLHVERDLGEAGAMPLITFKSMAAATIQSTFFIDHNGTGGGAGYGLHVDSENAVASAAHFESAFTVSLELEKGIHITSDDGTHGGYLTRVFAASTGTLPAATTDTIQLNIPTGWVIQGCQLHVKTALAGGDTWDAELNDGSQEEVIASNQAVAQNTNVNHHASADAGYGGTLTDAETDILITKNGGGSFTAQGEIEATCIAKGFDAWDAE